MLKNLKIGIRLGLGFGAVPPLLPAIALLTNEESENERYRKLIEQLRADTDGRIAEPARLVASATGKKLLKQITERHGALEPMYARFHGLARGDRQRAAEFVSKEYMPLNRALIEATDDLVKHQSDKMLKNMIAKPTQVVGEVNGGAQSLSQAASEQAAGVEEMSASPEQMTASISQNTENARVTDGMAAQAAREPAEGGEAVKTANKRPGIAMHNPAFASDTDLDESNFTRF